MSSVRQQGSRMSSYTVIRDAFSFASRQSMYEFAFNSHYKIGNSDRTGKGAAHQYLTAEFSEDDMDRLGFFRDIQSEELISLIDGRHPSRVICNLTQPQNVHYNHSHDGQHSLVYYMNLDWDDDWAGETIVYKDNGEDIAACIPFRPGQVLWLEQGIPHSLRAPSLAAPNWRFTLALFFSCEG